MHKKFFVVYLVIGRFLSCDKDRAAVFPSSGSAATPRQDFGFLNCHSVDSRCTREINRTKLPFQSTKGLCQKEMSVIIVVILSPTKLS